MSELIAQLRALIDQNHQIQGAVRAAGEELQQALEQVQATTIGSDNDLVAELIGHWQSGLEKLHEAQSLLAAGDEQMENYIGLLLGEGQAAATSSDRSGRKPPGRTPAGIASSGGPDPIKGPAGSTPPTKVGKRHLVGSIKLNSPAKEKNTIVLPTVDTDADIAAIKNGSSRWLGNNLYEVNGRVYGIETPSGTVYPVGGEGLVEMNKLEFTAFKGLLAYGGDRNAAERDPKIARFHRHMTDQDWDRARRVYEQAR
ncbi:hypothetical protein [Glycomyces halotolerans]